MITYKFAIALVLALVSNVLFAQTADDVKISISDTKVIITEVTSIDPEKRVVVLKNEDDELYSVKVIEEIKDFDQIEVGDKVRFEYYQLFEAFLAEPDEKLGVKIDNKMSISPTIREITTGKDSYEDISVIEEIDIDNRIVTLKNAQGELSQFNVEDSVEGFEKLKVGEKIKSIYTREVSISLEKP